MIREEDITIRHENHKKDDFGIAITTQTTMMFYSLSWNALLPPFTVVNRIDREVENKIILRKKNISLHLQININVFFLSSHYHRNSVEDFKDAHDIKVVINPF